MSKPITITQVPCLKLAAIREPGQPAGTSAPCWFFCPCGDQLPAFTGEQSCTCGRIYDGRGWLIAEAEGGRTS